MQKTTCWDFKVLPSSCNRSTR